jgi:23S rRNA-/tRNA-specific pseudouridylate synthase
MNTRLGVRQSPSQPRVISSITSLLSKNVILGLLFRPSKCLSVRAYFARPPANVPSTPPTKYGYLLPRKSPILFSLLVDDVRKAYQIGETDGILEYAASLDSSAIRVDDIVSVTLDVAEGRSGEVASMMNAWIGACSIMEDRKVASDLVLGLVEAFEELEEDRNIAPDIVTYSLAYSALHEDLSRQGSAAYFVQEAARRSKKAAGGKRRKALAVARRKGRVANVKDLEDDLRRLCGEDFCVLHETDDLFVINKPSGVPCFHRKTTTAGKIRKGKGPVTAEDISLEDALITCNAPMSTLNPEALGVVHRLDRGSSGCLVLAKNEETHALLVSEFFLRRTGKLYTTILSPWSNPSVPEEGSIDHPVDGRPAKSRYRLLERVGPDVAIIEFEIFTGRKHQIRVHASEVLGSPVYMDTMYGEDKKSNVGKGRFLLHSSKLQIPKFGLDVEAPRPLWWNDVIAALKANPQKN